MPDFEFCVTIRIPRFPDKGAARRWADLEFPGKVLDITSMAEYGIIQEERRTRQRDRDRYGDGS